MQILKIKSNMNHIIVTGHSKGLGAGLSTHLLKAGYHVHGISRTDNTDWSKFTEAGGSSLTFYPCDLSQPENIAGVMADVFQTIKKSPEVTGLFLVNNAGIIYPIGNIETLEAAEIDKHIKLNLTAPMLLTREFVNLSGEFRVEKRIMNISSGAAVNPYQGWSAYCSGKAGLDMFTRCCAEEQEREEFPVKMMAVAPGIIDTDMQTIIRDTTDEQFIYRQKFIELKETGQLVAPEKAGKKLMELLLTPDFKNGDITDIRHLY